MLNKQEAVKQKEHLVNIKTNQGYGRLRRRGENGVKEEILLVGIGHNLRKYHR